MKTDAVRTESSCFSRGFDRKLRGIVTASLFSSPSDLLGNSWLFGESSSHEGREYPWRSRRIHFHAPPSYATTSSHRLPSSLPPHLRIVQLLSLASPMGLLPMQFALRHQELPPLLERTYGTRSFPPLLERTYGVLGFWPKTTTLLHTPRPVL